jgi:hypothetical protein
VRNAIDHDEELNVEYRVIEPKQVRWFAARGRTEPGNPRLPRGVARHHAAQGGEPRSSRIERRSVT